MSESQERMMAVVEPGDVDAFLAICEKWEVEASVIGEVTDTGHLQIDWHGERVVDVPPASVAHDGPTYRRPFERPAWQDDLQADGAEKLPRPATGDDLRATLLRLAGSPNLCDKSWITDQYDRYVRGNTVLAQPSDSGMIRVDDESNLGVAVSTDCNGRFAKLDPYAGAQLAFVEAYRNVAATGAVPLAMSDCLNFGSPEDPAVMWQFAEACRGLTDACVELGVPVTGGNVSLYNQTGETAILPTPVVAVLGVIDDVTRRTPSGFVAEGERIFLLGETREELSGSEWAHVVHGHLGGVPPRVDLGRREVAGRPAGRGRRPGHQRPRPLRRRARPGPGGGHPARRHRRRGGGPGRPVRRPVRGVGGAGDRDRAGRRRSAGRSRRRHGVPLTPLGRTGGGDCRSRGSSRSRSTSSARHGRPRCRRPSARDRVDRRTLLRSPRSARRGGRGCAEDRTRRWAGADRRTATMPRQYAELYRPDGGSRGVVVVIHGGFWKAEYDAELGQPLAESLAEGLDDVEPGVPPRQRRGFPTHSRRRGGGDRRAAGAGLEPRSSRSATRPAATSRPGLRRAVGSSGGSNTSGDRVVSQAGVLDLDTAHDQRLGGGAVEGFMGVPPGPDTESDYRLADPTRHLPLDVPLRCVHGTRRRRSYPSPVARVRRPGHRRRGRRRGAPRRRRPLRRHRPGLPGVGPDPRRPAPSR